MASGTQNTPLTRNYHKNCSKFHLENPGNKLNQKLQTDFKSSNFIFHSQLSDITL